MSTAEPVLDGQHLATAASALTDDEVRALAARLGTSERDVLARALGLPGAALRRSPHPAALLAKRMARGPLQLRVEAARLLVQGAIDDALDALGERSDDPARDDVLEVLPGLLERHGVGAIRLMLASYVVPDAKAAAVFADLLATDERLAVGARSAEATPDAEPADSATDTRPATGPDEPDQPGEQERAALRRRRRDAKDARRAARRAEEEARARSEQALREARRRAKRT